MKKYLFMILIIYNCNNTLEIPVFENRYDALMWVKNTIEYKLRDDVDNWQTPEETLHLKSGVCSDMSILLMYILKSQFGDDPELVAIRILGHAKKHAIVKSANNYYDIIYDTTSQEYSYYILNTYDYNFTMFWANLIGR